MTPQNMPAGGSPTAGCPDHAVLAAIQRGAADNAVLSTWSEHIETCTECDAVLAGLDEHPDPLVAAFAGLEPTATCCPGAAAKSWQIDSNTSFPRFFGDYVLESFLGAGGMGIVFKAVNRRLNRVVALKQIPGALERSDEALLRFRTECEAAAKLNHPHITTLFEAGREEGIPFFAMELVTGGSLDEKLRKSALQPHDAAALVETIARAIQHAHEKGVIHRDLKPRNILLSEDGQPKISDFGLAKLADESIALTITGKVMGTPAYMAPEQARGRNEDIGPRTDVYGIGAILYECLTQRPPFAGVDRHEIMRQVVEDEPCTPRRLVPNLPRDLETICLKCLQKEPGKRYASAQALAEDLHSFREGLPISARPVGHVERFGRWCVRKPGLAAATFVAALLFIGLLVALVAYTALVSVKDRQEADARLNDERRSREIERTEQDRTNAERVAAVERFAGLLSDNEGRAARRPPGWTVQNQQTLREALRLGVEPEPYLVKLRTQLAETLSARDLSPPREIFVPLRKDMPKAKFGPGPIAFRPNGKYLAVGQHIGDWLSGHNVHLLDSQTWKIVRSLPIPASPNPYEGTNGASCLSFSPDGDWLALATRDGKVHLWDLREKQPRCKSWTAHKGDIDTLAFARDGATLVTKANDRKLIRWKLNGWFFPTPAATYDCRPLDVRDVGVSPPGAPEEFFAFYSEGAIHFLDADFKEDGKPVLDAGRLPTISPDGRTVVVSNRLSLRVIDRQTRRIEYQLASHDQVTHDRFPDEKLVFSPDASLLATANEHSGLVKLWEMASGKLIAVGKTKGGRANLAFSPDGRTLVTTGENHIYVFPIDAGVEQRPEAVSPCPIRSFTFHPRGRFMAVHTVEGPQRGLACWRLASGPRNLQPENRLTFEHPGNYAGTGLLAMTDTPEPWVFYRSGPTLARWNGTSRIDDQLLVAPKLEVIRHVENDKLLLGDGIEVYEYDAQTKKKRAVFNNKKVDDDSGRGGIRMIAVQGKTILIGDGAGYVHCLDREMRRKDISRRLDDHEIRSVAVSPDETTALVGDKAGHLYLLKLPTLEPLAELPAHADSVEDTAFVNDDLMATASNDGTVRFMKRTGETLFTIPFGRPVVQMERVITEGGEHQLGVLLRNERAVRIWHLEKLWQRFREFGVAGGLPGLGNF